MRERCRSPSGGVRARRGARPRPARRPARPGQTSLAQSSPRARGALRADRRSGARAQGRHRGAAQRPGARGLLRRRGPPPQPGSGDSSIPPWRPAPPITIGQGAGARVVTSTCPFTLIGATTCAGLLTTPLRDRFGIQHRFSPTAPTTSRGSRRSAAILDVSPDEAGVVHRRALARHAARPTACSSACATGRRCAAAGSSTTRR